MKLTIPFISLLFVFILSCTNANKGDVAFSHFSDEFIDALWKQYPNWALSVGYHAYDSILAINDDAQRKSELAFTKKYLERIEEFDLDLLSTTHKTDYILIKNFLESRSLYQVIKSYEWNPSGANYGSLLFKIINNDKASLLEKVNSATKFLSYSPEYYEVWKAQLKIPTKEHTALAIRQLKGTVAMLRKDVTDSFIKVKADTDVIQKAVSSINGFITHLEKMKKSMASGDIKPKSFRLGKDLFFKKFDAEIQSKYSAEEIYEKAQAEKKSLHQQMYKLALKLAPKYLADKNIDKDSLVFIKRVIDKISLSHIDRDNFQNEIVRQIPILTDFVNQKKLIFIDLDKPLEVRKEPDWMAGIAGASISSPGPYDKDGTTFYNVGSLAKYTDEEAESYLREYNQYTLQILNIHEAIPGHYVQLLYSNMSPSLVQSILQNGAMIEGWAVYAERMMMEEGWDRNTTINKVASPDEMWLMYLKWRLRICCNTILDYSVHVLNMQEEQALDLLIHQAFQEQKEATSKWTRSTLTQVQLCSYFTGYTEIYELREKLKANNPQFDLKSFHEELLKLGSAPIKYTEKMFDVN